MKTEEKAKAVFSRFVKAGWRSYFFDVNQRDGRRWLSICESRQGEDGKYVRNRLFVSPESAGVFMEALAESMHQLGAEGRSGA